MESFINISTKEDTLIVKSCCLIQTLFSKQKIQLPEKALIKLVEWILRCIDQCFYSVLCEALNVLRLLLKENLIASQMVNT